MFIDFEVNSDRLPRVSAFLSSFLLGGGGMVIASEIEGNLNVGDFTCVNRSRLQQGVGTGVFSYIADSNVGRYSMIGSRVSIGGFDHPKDWLSVAAFQWGQSIEHWSISERAANKLRENRKPKPKITEIGPDTWIGNNAIILSGRSLGLGAIVGAGTVVTADVEDYSIVVGNPHRHIGYRFDAETRQFLKESKWWEMNLEDLVQVDFSDIIHAVKQIKSLNLNRLSESADS